VKHSSTGVIPTYTLAVNVLASCGDGIIGPFENCDDSNQNSGDGCSSLCKIEYPTETEPNDTCATANGPLPVPSGVAGVVRAGSITPAGENDWYSFTIPVRADVRFETFDANGPSTCAAINTVIQAFAADCTTPLGVAQDQGGVGNCSRIDPTTLAYARQLAPGTYNVRVNAFSAAATFNYTVQARMMSECGNGLIEGFEQCDGGPTCDADCVLIPGCGNGLLEIGEACDDGNLTDSDGCSAVCLTEAGYSCAGTPGVCVLACGESTTTSPETCDDGNTLNGDGCDSSCATETTVAEIEPNGTIAEADTNAVGGLEITAASTIISGAIGVTGDQDFFRMTLAAPQIVRMETFDSTGDRCVSCCRTAQERRSSRTRRRKASAPARPSSRACPRAPTTCASTGATRAPSPTIACR
jgi:cysteine-rich repeat protein